MFLTVCDARLARYRPMLCSLPCVLLSSVCLSGCNKLCSLKDVAFVAQTLTTLSDFVAQTSPKVIGIDGLKVTSVGGNTFHTSRKVSRTS